MKWDRGEPSPRDILLDRVRRGEITPEQAEREAQSLGLEPFETQPSLCDLDLDAMHWWSLPMALAWIAWRNSSSVREHCAEYGEERRIFVPGSWNVPINNGTEFARIDGHELTAFGPSTVNRLQMTERYLASTEALPSTTQMTIEKALKQLIDALAAGRIIAVGKDTTGLPVDIPQREWPYLELVEEQQADVLKRNALDRLPAFSDVRLPADVLKKIWEEYLIEPSMIEPMTRPRDSGYVSLCSALHWIMTEGGNLQRHLEDTPAWNAAVRRLMSLISTGEVEIIGRNLDGQPKPIERHLFAEIPVGHPLRVCFRLIGGDGPWISCTPYVDDDYWGRDFNDVMYLNKAASPTWTHLQVRKSDVLRHVIFDNTKIKNPPALALKKKSSSPLHQLIKEVVKELWPDGRLPARVQERDAAIMQRFKARKLAPPSAKTIGRALKLD